MDDIYDVIVIGAGASGLTAGIYSARSGLSTLIIEEGDIGGVACNSFYIGNYPGFPDGIGGIELMDKFYEQAVESGVMFSFNSVDRIQNRSKIKYVFTKDKIFKAYGIIIATGGKAKRVGALNESEFIGKGISFCSLCDGPDTKDKEVLVIGTGDTAIDQILYLSHYSREIFVSSVNAQGEFDCKDMKKLSLLSSKVKYLWDTRVYQFQGKEYLEGVTLVNKDDEFFDLSCDYCFEFIGFIPNSHQFKDIISVDEQGFIITDENMKTITTGIYAVGDVRRKEVKQLTTATSDGTIAAYNIKKYIDCLIQ